jgi:hypothetical protein
MTVAELINALQEFDPKLRVIVRGYEGGYDDVDTPNPLEIALEVHDAWYYGKHEYAEAGCVPPGAKRENAVLIG